MAGLTASLGRRERPLSMRVPGGQVALGSDDVNLLLAGIDALVDGPHASHLGELEMLRRELLTAPTSLLSPPLQIGDDEARVLRNVLVDLTGYQRVELTAGLDELQQLLIPV
jgi:hypothetical protein